MSKKLSRQEFSNSIKRKLRERVAYMCCNPMCRMLTVKPNAMNDGIVRSGKAAHIYAASKEGPRSKHNKKASDLKSFENGIWLCDKCSREIDDNELLYPPDLLEKWKKQSELYIESLVTHDTRLRHLRILMNETLAVLRILNALPGPGINFDQTFRNERQIDLTRILLETEQVLFENEFIEEADLTKNIYDEVDLGVYQNLKNNHDPHQYLNISEWKNRIIKIVMKDIMRFSDQSFERYFSRETQMVEDRIKEITSQSPPKKIKVPIIPDFITEIRTHN